MRLPSETAAELRSTTDPARQAKLRNELATVVRALLVRVMRGKCERHGAAADVEDAAQELAVDLVDRIVRGRIPPRPGEEDRYIHAAARNRACDVLRGKGIFKHRRFDALGPERGADPFERAQRQVEHEQREQAVRDALATLSETYREVIEAHDYRGVPLETIAAEWFERGRAETLQKARQNVQAAHSRGKKTLRLILQRQEEDESS